MDPIVTADEALEGAFWELPADSLGQQWLFRLRARKAKDSVRLRLALRLAGPQDFELEALDTLGRRQWSLRGKENRIIWLDHRERTLCQMADSITLPEALPIPVAPWALVRVLLGRAPQTPQSGIAEEGSLRIYEDSLGQRWVVELGEHGQVVSWSGKGHDGRGVSWERGDENAVLVVESAELEVTWKAVAKEPLRRRLVPPVLPDGYREVDCTRNR